MSHPHEYNKEVRRQNESDLWWLWTKGEMIRKFPLDYKEIRGVELLKLFGTMLAIDPTSKRTMHYRMNAYREVLEEFLRDEGRADEINEMRAYIEEIKRDIREEERAIQDAQMEESILLEYMAQVVPFVYELGETIRREEVVALGVRAYHVLVEMREKKSVKRYNLSDEDLFAIVCKEFNDMIVARITSNTFTSREANNVLAFMSSCYNDLAEELTEKHGAKLTLFYEPRDPHKKADGTSE